MTEREGFLLLDRAAVEAMLDRWAAAIHARLGGEVGLVGIRRRGAPLAEMLAQRVGRLPGGGVEVGEMELQRYADDLTILHERTWMAEPDLPFDVAGQTVVLVDDVLYTGRTILRASAWLADAGAACIYCAVLCSRGAVELPVEAAFAAMRLDVGEGNVVELHIPPYEDDLSLWIRRRPAAEA